MNISAIKTPGVYINEIDAFPPSIAQVATAIPVFIGYTEKLPTEFQNKVVKISSKLDFERKFGGAAPPSAIKVYLDANNQPTDACTVEGSIYKTYNSLQLFYLNGGGECYVISIGTYADSPNKTKFSDALTLLENADAPTLILFPDAINLSSADLAEVQKLALMHCGKLMNRFCIFDVKNNIENISIDRTGYGTANLKYGASYYPQLQSKFDFKFSFKDINGNTDGKVNFSAIYASNASIVSLMGKSTAIDSALNDPTTGFVKKWNDAIIAINATKALAGDTTKTSNYVKEMFKGLAVLGKPATSLAAANLADLKAEVNVIIPTSLKSLAQSLFNFKAGYNAIAGFVAGDKVAASVPTEADFEDSWKGGANFTVDVSNPYAAADVLTNGAAVDMSKVQAELDKVYLKINAAMNDAMFKLAAVNKQAEDTLTSQIPIYPAIIAKLGAISNQVPPSGAIAGIYAQIDATRGVWKAPANISLNGVSGLVDDINDFKQESMNIHESGKSINAIRFFTNKGFLVWGARTLDGNSNDWRYINVRRLAIMIEMSAKAACQNFVFEPNVKSTWVVVKGMIENYLTMLWNEGALAGAKPEHAFFVQVGLGTTMSSQDVNEGRMIVKIGYAPSRPAEFIILEFKQMQQLS